MANSHPPICPCSTARLGRDILFRQGGLFCLHVVAPEHAVVANVESAIRDDRVGPRFFHRIRVRRLPWREPPLLAISLGTWLHQRDFPIFSMKIEPSAGVAE